MPRRWVGTVGRGISGFVATANLTPGPYQQNETLVGLEIVELPVVTLGSGIVTSALPHRFEFTELGTYDVELRIQSANTGTSGTAGVYTYPDTVTAVGAGTFVTGTGGFYSGTGTPPAASVRTGSIVVASLPTYVDAAINLGDPGIEGILTGPGENGPSDLGTRLTLTRVA